MDIDAEIKKLVDEYVSQIEAKSEDLEGLRRNIDDILAASDRKLAATTAELDKKFDAHEISEEEYLAEFRKTKDELLETTKSKLDELLAKYEKIYDHAEI